MSSSEYDPGAPELCRERLDRALISVAKRESLCLSGTWTSRFCHDLAIAAAAADMAVIEISVESLGAVLRRSSAQTVAAAFDHLAGSVELIVVAEIGVLPVSPDADAALELLVAAARDRCSLVLGNVEAAGHPEP